MKKGLSSGLWLGVLSAGIFAACMFAATLYITG